MAEIIDHENAVKAFSYSFTVEQKASIVLFLQLLAKCDKPANAVEEKEIFKVMNLLDISVNDLIFTKIKPEKLQIFIIENLKILNEDQKYWFMILCYEFINVDGPIVEIEHNYLGNIGDAIGVTEANFNEVLNKAYDLFDYYKRVANSQIVDTKDIKTNKGDIYRNLFLALTETFPIEMLFKSNILTADDLEIEMKNLSVNYKDTFYSFEFTQRLNFPISNGNEKLAELNFKVYYEVDVKYIIVYDANNSGFCSDFFQALKHIPECKAEAENSESKYFYKYKIPNKLIKIRYVSANFNDQANLPNLIFQTT